MVSILNLWLLTICWERTFIVSSILCSWIWTNWQPLKLSNMTAKLTDLVLILYREKNWLIIRADYKNECIYFNDLWACWHSFIYWSDSFCKKHLNDRSVYSFPYIFNKSIILGFIICLRLNRYSSIFYTARSNSIWFKYIETMF